MLRAMPCPCLAWSVPMSRAERCLNKTPVWIQVETRSTQAVLLFRANRKSGNLSTTHSARWISPHWHINRSDPQSNLSMISSVSTMLQVTHPPIFEGIHTVFLQKSLRGDGRRVTNQYVNSPIFTRCLKESLSIQISFVRAGITEPNQKPSKH